MNLLSTRRGRWRLYLTSTKCLDGTRQMTSRLEESSPSLFLDTVNAYQRTAVIKAAIQFDVFTMIGGGSETVQRLASKCETSERGMRVLCDCLTVIGFLIKEGQHYRLTP